MEVPGSSWNGSVSVFSYVFRDLRDLVRNGSTRTCQHDLSKYFGRSNKRIIINARIQPSSFACVGCLSNITLFKLVKVAEFFVETMEFDYSQLAIIIIMKLYVM